MKRFKEVIFVVILLTIGGVSHAQRVCNFGELSTNCPLNDDPHGLRNIYNQQDSAAAQAEAQRQWQIREDAVQASIAKKRATPAYGAVAISTTDFTTGWGGGYKTQEDAVKNALKGYRKGEARIVAIISNTCAGVSAPRVNMGDVIVATHKNGRTALEMAWNQCETKYGKGQCVIHHDAKAMCAGYDYGLYGVE